MNGCERCLFSAYYGFDEGAKHFATAHKIFGVSIVLEHSLHIPILKRWQTVVRYPTRHRLHYEIPSMASWQTVVRYPTRHRLHYEIPSMASIWLLSAHFGLAATCI